MRNYIVFDTGTYLKPEARPDLIEAIYQTPSQIVSKARTEFVKSVLSQQELSDEAVEGPNPDDPPSSFAHLVP